MSEYGIKINILFPFLFLSYPKWQTPPLFLLKMTLPLFPSPLPASSPLQAVSFLFSFSFLFRKRKYPSPAIFFSKLFYFIFFENLSAVSKKSLLNGSPVPRSASMASSTTPMASHALGHLPMRLFPGRKGVPPHLKKMNGKFSTPHPPRVVPNKWKEPLVF